MINKWAEKWGVPRAALADLRIQLARTATAAKPGKPEAVVQQALRLEASRRGIRLWRNNNGACMDQTGRMIRYGLGNDSSKVNSYIKSSDLIGITPVTITPQDAGRTLGVFTSIEAKRSGWKFTGAPREKAQLKWLELVAAMGGIGKFAACVEDL